MQQPNLLGKINPTFMCSVLYFPSPWVENNPNCVVFNPLLSAERGLHRLNWSMFHSESLRYKLSLNACITQACSLTGMCHPQRVKLLLFSSLLGLPFAHIMWDQSSATVQLELGQDCGKHFRLQFPWLLLGADSTTFY